MSRYRRWTAPLVAMLTVVAAAACTFRESPSRAAQTTPTASAQTGTPATAAPQRSAALDSIARNNIYTFESTNGRLTGAGADLLRQLAADAQFVALGEGHNTRAIPELTVGLFRMLHDNYGFNYVALEEGPGLGDLLSRRYRRGDRDAAFRIGLEFPNAFHMYTEEELRMVDRLAAISTDTAAPIWGVNQEFGIVHVLERLHEIAPHETARRAAAGLMERALEYEGERFALNTHYMARVLDRDDVESLRAAFAPAGPEATRLLDQVALSRDIYEPYRMQPRPHITVFFESGMRREENMKVLFAEQYRAAQARGVELPKVLVKSGHVHLNRGIGQYNETLTLGNFLTEVATMNGTASLHLHVIVPWNGIEETIWAPFLEHLQEGTNTMFDVRPMRGWAAHNAFRGLQPELRRILMGVDLLIFMGDRTRGSVDAFRTPRFRQYTSSG